MGGAGAGQLLLSPYPRFPHPPTLAGTAAADTAESEPPAWGGGVLHTWGHGSGPPAVAPEQAPGPVGIPYMQTPAFTFKVQRV